MYCTSAEDRRRGRDIVEGDGGAKKITRCSSSLTSKPGLHHCLRHRCPTRCLYCRSRLYVTVSTIRRGIQTGRSTTAVAAPRPPHLIPLPPPKRPVRKRRSSGTTDRLSTQHRNSKQRGYARYDLYGKCSLRCCLGNHSSAKTVQSAVNVQPKRRNREIRTMT